MLFQNRTACEQTPQFNVIRKEKAMQIERCTPVYPNFSENETLLDLYRNRTGSRLCASVLRTTCGRLSFLTTVSFYRPNNSVYDVDARQQ